MEKTVCKLVKQHWDDLHPSGDVPEFLVFMKVASKTSPNASIIGMILDASNRCPVAVAKIPRNPKSTLGLERENISMIDLRRSVSNAKLLSNTSCYGVLVKYKGVNILLQKAGSGQSMVRQMTSRVTIESIYEKILPWMFDFHIDGAKEYCLEGDVLIEFVEKPVSKFFEQYQDIARNILSEKAQQYLYQLPIKTQGQAVSLCRQHGDFNAHNILVEYNYGSLKDFTLIDWEDYRTLQLPIHDLNHFFTSNSNLLGAGMTPDESYAKFVLNNGWYRDLYMKAVKAYEAHGLIDHETFLSLTPLYLVDTIHY
ncbi:hypothetical protein ACFLYW_02270 [Thermodesulfobacteriota bacterium]